MAHYVLSGFGLAAAGAMAVWCKFMFPNRGIFLLALLIYSTGAFGFELVSTEVAARYGTGATYIILGSVEELLEVAGCLFLFVATLKMALPSTAIDPNQ